jgi:putative transposase
MPRSPRCVVPGLAYHVTQRGTNREPVFLTDADRECYLRLLRDNLDETGVRVLAYCLMTNHVHLIIVPERDESMAVLLRRANGRYAQCFNALHGRSGHLWQNRFFSCALGLNHLWTALRYVEQNPVRACASHAPAEYEWSSAKAHLLGTTDRSGLLDLDFWREEGGVERWRDLHDEPEDPRQVQILKRCTYAGRPFGEESFVQQFEDRFRRRWRRWSFEDTSVQYKGMGIAASASAQPQLTAR